MSSDLLPAIAAFASVARHGSFTRAADELEVSVSALSQTVRHLEKRLGVRLLDRSTRRVGLTELGRQFLGQAEPGLQQLDAALAGLDEQRDRPAGVLRLNVSAVSARSLLLPHLPAFAQRYPAIVIELHSDNRLLDLVEGGFDAGLRLGESLARDVIAVPLGGARRMACFASPAYLKGRPAPRTPDDLARHRCLGYRHSSGAPYRWEFARDGKDFTVPVAGWLIANDVPLLIDAAREGAGIAMAIEDEVTADFARGTLVPLLEDWWPRFPGFSLYYANRAQMPRKLRVFIDFLRERLAAGEG